MTDFFSSPFFGIFLSILTFEIGRTLQKKTGAVICNPLLIAIVLIIGVLLIFKIPYEAYEQGGSVINMCLAPATACLAVSIYNKIEILKEHWLPILVGCTCGSLTSMVSVYILCQAFHLDEKMTVALLPKSVTLPIAMGIVESHDGLIPITIVAIVFTGMLGSLAAPLLIKLFRVKDPAVAGLSIGACSHAVGTSRALQIGETEGAMSGLAIGICGLLTVLFSFFIL